MNPGIHDLNEIFADCKHVAGKHLNAEFESDSITDSRASFYMTHVMDLIGYSQKAIVITTGKHRATVRYNLGVNGSNNKIPDEHESAMLAALLKRWVDDERGCCPYCDRKLDEELPPVGRAY